LNGFAIAYEGFDPAREGLREALTSTGNGYLCTRGAAEWEDADGVHYPGTYAHGVYNRETTILGGLPVHNEDLVNLPNWLVLKLRIEGEDAIKLSDVEVFAYRHEYDIRNAMVIRELCFRDHAGRQTALRSRRFVSMADVHHGGIEWTLTPQNWSGRVEVVTAIDGRVTNSGVARYGQLEGRHLDPVGPRTFGSEVIALKVETRQSNLYVGQAARTRVFDENRMLSVDRGLYQTEDYIQQILTFDVHQGRPMRIEKMVTFYSSRDRAISDTLSKVGATALRYVDFGEALERHVSAWDELWKLCDIQVPDDQRVQLLLRLHICHVLQVCCRNTVDRDAGVPARGLNGEAYRGHVFWDELYIYPYLNFRVPEVTRELLLYRYHRLDEARAAAWNAGYRGAMFPWQSGSDGTEETQRVHLNPLSGRWEPDLSHTQRHVNAAIFYNIWHYYQATHDLAFIRDHGAEMMLEIARFWASIAHFNPERDRYEIHGVMGPDEFHEKYPDSKRAGLRNNAYTNVMVAWLCGLCREVLSLLPATRAEALREKLDVTDAELRTWDDLSRRMFVPFHADDIISQFEGYGDLLELDWDAYREKYGNIQRLDRILRAEGDTPDRYQLAKQADTVMLFFLFSDEELRQMFGRLGYVYGPETARKNIAYYDQRTSHGSTLSFVTHAGALASLDTTTSWERFLVALESDIGDIQGDTTKEGIHLGVMSGTLDLVQRSYAGIFIRDDTLCFDPKLTGTVERLSFLMRFRRTPIWVRFANGLLTVAVDHEGGSPPIRVDVGDQVRELRAGDRYTFRLRPEQTTAHQGTEGEADQAESAVEVKERSRFQAVIFDVDGVLVDSPHEKAWRESLRELMEGEWSDIRGQTIWSPEAFTSLVYQEEMSGKPRMSGARAALKRFKIPNPAVRAEQYASYKQDMVVRLIEAGDFTAFPDALRLIIAVKDAGLRVAAASSSKNAGLFLRQIRLDSFADQHDLRSTSIRPGLTLLDFFDADVSGRDFVRGKPHPEMFLTAASELGVTPELAIVIEDAPAGVQAAKAGGMAAVGIERAEGANLLAAGATIVVTTLDSVDVAALSRGRLATL
jgi:trehalose/maltose hydrolase-like predicted phosphorylase/beta-phosphoglucomutase-like phosphatase (HAD superfamily)